MFQTIEQLEAYKDATERPNLVMSDGKVIFFEGETFRQEEMNPFEQEDLLGDLIDYRPYPLTRAKVEDHAEAILIVRSWLLRD